MIFSNSRHANGWSRDNFSNQITDADEACRSYIYMNVWKSSQHMNLRDVGSETSVNDTVQANKNDK
jgi:hypothetical protein